MTPQEIVVRRKAFLTVLCRTHGHWPRQPLEQWADRQFSLILGGRRHSVDVSDEALSAWAWSDRPAETTSSGQRLIEVSRRKR